MFADFAHNAGPGDWTGRYSGQDNAFAVGVKYGQNKKKGDWSVKYRYARIEANALPGMFVDDDFGGTNRQGHVIGAEYSILDNLTTGVNLFFTEPIFAPTSASGASPYEDRTTTLFFDVLWKF